MRAQKWPPATDTRSAAHDANFTHAAPRPLRTLDGQTRARCACVAVACSHACLARVLVLDAARRCEYAATNRRGVPFTHKFLL
eukprot:2380333-Pleurochrysis_carterae.AAC.3